MEVTIGRIVIFKLLAEQAEQINRRRTDVASISERMKNTGWSQHWHDGTQAHIGNQAFEGYEYPLIVTQVWSPGCVNGQVLLDGNDCLWVTSSTEGDQNGQWHWPVIEKSSVAPQRIPELDVIHKKLEELANSIADKSKPTGNDAEASAESNTVEEPPASV